MVGLDALVAAAAENAARAVRPVTGTPRWPARRRRRCRRARCRTPRSAANAARTDTTSSRRSRATGCHGRPGSPAAVTRCAASASRLTRVMAPCRLTLLTGGLTTRPGLVALEQEVDAVVVARVGTGLTRQRQVGVLVGLGLGGLNVGQRVRRGHHWCCGTDVGVAIVRDARRRVFDRVGTGGAHDLLQLRRQLGRCDQTGLLGIGAGYMRQRLAERRCAGQRQCAGGERHAVAAANLHGSFPFSVNRGDALSDRCMTT